MTRQILIVDDEASNLEAIARAIDRTDELPVLSEEAIVAFRDDETDTSEFAALDDDYFALLAEHGTELSANLIESDGTWLTVSPEKAAQGFYGACDEATVQQAVARLRPTSLNCWNLITPIPEPWLQIRSLYIVCSQDEAMPPGMQRVLAGNATETAELDTDHSPFFSANSELCDLLVGRTEAVSVAAG